MRSISFDTLASDLLNKPRKQSSLLIGVDGGGGAGKSMFAKYVVRVSNVHTDDFFRPLSANSDPGPDGAVDGEIDWRRLLDQVVSPLKYDCPGRYQRYDWPLRTLQEWHLVDVGGIVIVEGI